MRCFFALLFISVLAASPAMAAGRIPPATMDNLAGAALQFPKSFTGEPTLVVLAFEHGQQTAVDSVLPLLEAAARQHPSLAWYEFPVIDSPPAIIRFFITNGMRDEIPEARHVHVVPYFVDIELWRKKADIQGKEPLLAKISAEGVILKAVPLADIKTLRDILQF